MKVTQNPTPNPLATGRTNEKAVDKSSLKPEQGQELRGEAARRSGATVEISDTARLMQKASESAHSAPDMRLDRISALKKSIADGSYKIDSAAIADRLVDEHLATDFGKNNV